MNPENQQKENKNKRLKWASAGAILLAIVLLAVPAFQMRQNNRGQMVAAGQALYHTNCQACHGEQGQGQDHNNPRGGLQPDQSYLAPALDRNGVIWYKTSQEIALYIKNGSDNPASSMKGFKGELTDQQITSLIVYLESLWPDNLRRQHQENDTSSTKESKGMAD